MVYEEMEIKTPWQTLREDNAQLRAEADALRGRLRELRRINRRLYREAAKGRKHASYWRQLIVLCTGVAVALTSLLYAVLMAIGGPW